MIIENAFYKIPEILMSYDHNKTLPLKLTSMTSI
jgi:hypothetical protein